MVFFAWECTATTYNAFLGWEFIATSYNGICFFGWEFTATTYNDTSFSLVVNAQLRHTMGTDVLGGFAFTCPAYRGTCSFGWKYAAIAYKGTLCFCLQITAIPHDGFRGLGMHGCIMEWNRLLRLGTHKYNIQWGMSFFGWDCTARTYSELCFGWEFIALTCSGTCFFGWECTSTTNNGTCFFCGWEFTAIRYNGNCIRHTNQSNKQWNMSMWFAIHSCNRQRNMILFGCDMTATAYSETCFFGWELTATTYIGTWFSLFGDFTATT